MLVDNSIGAMVDEVSTDGVDVSAMVTDSDVVVVAMGTTVKKYLTILLKRNVHDPK
jgi:hypothetical protein